MNILIHKLSKLLNVKNVFDKVLFSIRSPRPDGLGALSMALTLCKGQKRQNSSSDI